MQPIVLVKDRDTDEPKIKNKLLVQDTTKTKNSNRKLPLTERSIKILKELKIKQQIKSNIVFCSENGTYVLPRNFERTFQKVVDKAGIEKCNAHTMRHVYATRLFEEGVAAKTVSDLIDIQV